MNLTIPSNLISSLGVPQIVDWRRDLPVNKNYTWAQLAGVRDINVLTTIVLHHDAIKKSTFEGKTDLEAATSIANTHINLKSNEPKGDAGFPYHVWIRNGTAYLCNNIEDKTYGVAANNGYTVHVCVSGEYAFTDVLTDPDRNALYAVIIALKQQLPAFEAIKAHKELNPTSCPGYDVNVVRTDVATIENRLLSTDTWQAKLNKIGELANQYNYMFDLSKGGETDGNANWAVNQLLEVRDVLKQKGLL